MKIIPTYSIQEWLFKEAEGKFNIDLAESGIQFHYFDDLKIKKNYDLNYSLDKGHYELRNHISQLYDVEIDNIIVTHGSQEALYLFYQCFLNSNDHVITFSPGWQQSWEVPRHMGCEVTVLPLLKENKFNIDLDKLRNSIKENTRLIILNSPNNPTGVTINENVLSEIVQLCKKNNIFLLNDEEYLIDYKKSIVKQTKNSASVSSLSKVYGFPGLRLGWFIGPRDVVQKMINYKRYTTVSNSSLCEYLGTEILKNNTFYLKEYRNLVQSNLPILKRYAEKSNLELIEPQGTPFAYFGLPDDINSWEFSRSLLKNEKVLIMPGEVFHHHSAIRVSFVRSLAILKEGLSKLFTHYQYFSSMKIK